MCGDYSIGQYFNLNLNKIITENGITITTPIEETLDNVTLSIEVPESLKPDDTFNRNYSIIRVHNGIASIINNLSNDKNLIAFETNKFSTFSIIYKDEVLIPSDSESDDESGSSTSTEETTNTSGGEPPVEETTETSGGEPPVEEITNIPETPSNPATEIGSGAFVIPDTTELATAESSTETSAPSPETTAPQASADNTDTISDGTAQGSASEISTAPSDNNTDGNAGGNTGSTDSTGNGTANEDKNQNTGVTLAVIPVLAAAAGIIFSKKRK